MEKEGYIAIIVRYIEKNLGKGYTQESLKWALLSQGYTKAEFEKAMKIVTENQAKNLPPVKEKPVIKYEAVSQDKPKEEKSFWKKITGLFG